MLGKMIVEEIRGDAENFPVGMRVLAVDDDPTCLKLLDTLLRKCHYNVTTTNQARVALKMIREEKDRFDLVISDVHMPDMDGFKLLELVGLELDLPVIMLSANSDPKLVMKGVTHGACDYLVKPIRIEELRNIWQHVVRRKKADSKNQNGSSNQVKSHQSGEGFVTPLGGNNNNQYGKFNRKRKDDEDEIEDDGNEYEEPGTQKKPRVVWSIELHRKFVAAVNQLGIDKAVPKRILDMMDVEGLSRENVASHLQKYRLYLKRISTVASQQANMAAAFGVKDAGFMHMGSLDGFGDFRSYSGARLNNVALPPYANNGMLNRLNSTGNVNLRNLTPSMLVQPSQAQNLNNSINSLGRMHLVYPNSTQNPRLLNGIQSSIELDQLQQHRGTANFNNINNSRIFKTGNTFADDGVALASSNNTLMLQGNAQQPLIGGGFGNQSTHNAASFTLESLHNGVSVSSNLLDPGKCNDNWHNSVNTSKMHPDPLISGEPCHDQLPRHFSRENNRIDLSSGMALLPFEDARETECQSWVEQRHNNHGHNSQISASGIMPNSGRSSGISNPKKDTYIDGRSGGSLMQQNPDGTRTNEDFVFEQPKLQRGFASQGYDSLDELVNAMIKREQDGTGTNGEFSLDDFSFGPGI